MSAVLELSDQQQLLRILQIFKIQGQDKHRRPVLRIIGKFFPVDVSIDVLKKYLEAEIYPSLNGRPFSILYVHTAVKRAENFPGVSALKSIYDAVPAKIRENIEAIYFLHPGLQSRLFLATCGRILFSGSGLYAKLKYVNRLDLLWVHLMRDEIEMPEFVWEFDEETDRYCPTTMDFEDEESNHPSTVYASPSLDYCRASARCIA